jgi:hypothetical protein
LQYSLLSPVDLYRQPRALQQVGVGYVQEIVKLPEMTSIFWEAPEME